MTSMPAATISAWNRLRHRLGHVGYRRKHWSRQPDLRAESKVSHIYAYEPMPHTFTCAVRLDANPALSAKITLKNLGVGSREGDLQVNYTKKAKAAIGVSEIPPRFKTLYRIKPEDMESITIHIADASEVLRAIRKPS